MKILVVSGFLGAGKTTFIKELIRRTGKFLVVLENEYGENDLDSRALKGSGEIEILEFMEGCVCCTKKDSFVNTILSISAAMDPEYLVVEPTGVGRLSNILENIGKVQYDRISLLPSILILSPRSLESNLANYGDICTDQIKNANRILFSKAEQEPPEILDAAEALVHAINPEAEVLKTHYSLQDDSWWNATLQSSADVSCPVSEPEAAELPDYQQISLQHACIANPGELIILLEDVLRGEFGRIPRAKGVLPIGHEYLRFDLADGLYGIIKDEDDHPVSQCVFIGKDIDMQALLRRLHTDEDVHTHDHHDHEHGEHPGHSHVHALNSI